jgi:hypothetical protein
LGDIITEVSKYQVGWKGGLPETVCGSGSRLSNTEAQREWIPAMVEKYKIKSIADIGAGDLNWVKKLDWDVNYTPYDLVPRQPEVKQFDLVQEVPPKVDMIMCLWVLNHFPYDHCKQALKNIFKSKAKYLMMTDRPIWREEQPAEIDMPFIEELVLNGKQDSIRLIKL